MRYSISKFRDFSKFFSKFFRDFFDFEHIYKNVTLIFLCRNLHKCSSDFLSEN